MCTMHHCFSDRLDVAFIAACAANCKQCTVAGQCTAGQCKEGYKDGTANDCVGAYILPAG
jgi:hypothetical protein